jgi:Domain of unknown function (DUF4192)
MRDSKPAGGQNPRTSTQPAQREPQATPRVKVGSVAGLLAVVPYLLGFHPSRSLVVIGADGPRGRIKVAFRYDLPDPPDQALSGDIAAHAAVVLSRQQVRTAIVVGYGAGAQVTPVADAVRAALERARIRLRDLIRVDHGRYWSYLCENPDCCTADGVPFDVTAEPAAAELTAAGLAAHPDRQTLARSLAAVDGPTADSMKQATERALSRVAELMAGGQAGDGDMLSPVVEAGRGAVRGAIASYRSGGQITDDDEFAWLSVTLADLRVRDDAWARMDPEHREAHQRLWADVVRRACPRFVPAPAALLAFTAWQSGEGALANMAIERALAADPDYSMALLLGQALAAGLPPSAARLPMTPEEVEASYADVAGSVRACAPQRSATQRSATQRPTARTPTARRSRSRSRTRSAKRRHRR